MQGETPSHIQSGPLASAMQYVVVGLGELLWDILPQGKHLGGAPSNFAYISALLGDRGVIASRVGDDDLGREAISSLQTRGLDTSSIQCDLLHPTGVVDVSFGFSNQAQYEFKQDSAWDFLEWTLDWRALAVRADAICFGSLAQRSAASCSTINSFLKHTRPGAVRVFDVNLRQSYFSADALRRSFRLASIAKLNDHELPAVLKFLDLAGRSQLQGAQALRDAFDLSLVCVTCGEKGSLLVTKAVVDGHPGVPVRVADTVGSGDASTAGMVHAYLRSRPLNVINRVANTLGSWVASHAGAMPPANQEILRTVRALLD
jgi:fructokinase